MRYLFLSVFAVILVGYSFVSCNQAGSGALKGEWMDDEQNTRIEFFQDGDTYSGKVVWLSNPTDSDGNPRLDVNNPDPEKQKQPILGMTIIRGLEYSDGSWINGKIYAPRRGIYANCKIKIVSDDRLELTVSKAMFSQTKVWTREK